MEQKNYLFKSEWTLYEQYKLDSRSSIQSEEAYNKCIKPIGDFKDFNEFAQIWFWAKFNTITDKFYSIKRIPRKFKDEKDEEKQIEAIALFRKGIWPKWEDPKNLEGSESFMKLITDTNVYEKFNDMYEKLIANVIIENIDNCDKIQGIVIRDKSTQKSISLRIEIWYSFKENQQLAEGIEKHYKDVVTKCLNLTNDNLAFEYKKTHQERTKN